MYIYRRSDNLIDAHIEDHFWLKITVTDGTSSTGDYRVVLGSSVFTATDSSAGIDDSAALAASLIVDINASSEPVTAYAGAAANEILLRYDQFGYSPVDVYNQNFNYSVSTTDDDGQITAREVRPSYNVKNASNWDGSFTTMQAVSNTGAVSDRFRKSSEQVAAQVNANQLRHRTRFLFDPNDYSLDDNDVLFFQETPVIDATEVFDGPIEIVMASRQYTDQRPPLILTGTVPVAADFDSSLELRLPRQTVSIEIKNSGGNPLFFAFGTGSAEWSLAASGVFVDNRLSTGYLNLRASGSPTTVEIYAVLSPDPGL